MITLKLCCEKDIEYIGNSIKGFLFDGNELSIAVEKHYEDTQNGRANHVKKIFVPSKYSHICYDYKDKCYWAICKTDYSSLYQLDINFREIGQILFDVPIQKSIVNISYDFCNNTIWVVFAHSIAIVDKKCGKITIIENQDKTQCNMSVVPFCGCTVSAYHGYCRQYLKISCQNCCETLEICIPQKYCFLGIVICNINSSENRGCIEFEICVLLSSNETNQMTIMNYCVEMCTDKWDDCCECHEYHECCECCNDNCIPNPSCGCGYNEIIHSIALEEAGIAHILNAEGEKIQKAVKICNNIEQLLCVNESVQKTLIHITQLEMTLYSKLEALINNCGC